MDVPVKHPGKFLLSWIFIGWCAYTYGVETTSNYIVIFLGIWGFYKLLTVYGDYMNDR